MSEQLADRIVVLGVVEQCEAGAYWMPVNDRGLKVGVANFPEELVRDGRVVLAMMEKLDGGQELTTISCNDGFWSAAVDYNNVTGDSVSEGRDRSLAIAILTACCDALEGT